MHVLSGRAYAVPYTYGATTQTRHAVYFTATDRVALASVNSTRRAKGMPASGGLPGMSEAQAIPSAVCLLFYY